jgi:hypothetical protein
MCLLSKLRAAADLDACTKIMCWNETKPVKFPSVPRYLIIN